LAGNLIWNEALTNARYRIWLNRQTRPVNALAQVKNIEITVYTRRIVEYKERQRIVKVNTTTGLRCTGLPDGQKFATRSSGVCRFKLAPDGEFHAAHDALYLGGAVVPPAQVQDDCEVQDC